ncbi:hypothetical protein AZE42_12181 [Rhizopogon vesiculosus]|uniref:Uncharacterized protein n=1 Tax=Rhizopogon vesiculosus TaxID=180088 RepID=A0A1J8QDW4_9AGAM|nr:hypothetical protein AZE42_12181 [Rhizopogon vesiculosus]
MSRMAPQQDHDNAIIPFSDSLKGSINGADGRKTSFRA